VPAESLRREWIGRVRGCGVTGRRPVPAESLRREWIGRVRGCGVTGRRPVPAESLRRGYGAAGSLVGDQCRPSPRDTRVDDLPRGCVRESNSRLSEDMPLVN